MPSEVFSERYELVRHIARGGMAQVYLAQDLLLVRPVAIRCFPRDSIDPSFVERFRRKLKQRPTCPTPTSCRSTTGARASARTSSSWSTSTADPFLLSARDPRAQPGRLDRRRHRQRADFAHRRGVIHRDVKPGNVLIDHTGQVKVADFGIARAVGPGKEGLTQTGAVMGTASYFYPSRPRVSPSTPAATSTRSGSSFTRWSGRPPFTGESPVAIAYKHVGSSRPRHRASTPRYRLTSKRSHDSDGEGP